MAGDVLFFSVDSTQGWQVQPSVGTWLLPSDGRQVRFFFEGHVEKPIPSSNKSGSRIQKPIVPPRF